MGTKIMPIGRPNQVAIAGMPGSDLLAVREYHILKLVQARRRNDSDTMEVAIDWLVALTSEIRQRGLAKEHAGIIGM